MLKKIYYELVAIRKELQAIRKSKEFFSVEPREFAELVPRANCGSCGGGAPEPKNSIPISCPPRH